MDFAEGLRGRRSLLESPDEAAKAGEANPNIVEPVMTPVTRGNLATPRIDLSIHVMKVQGTSPTPRNQSASHHQLRETQGASVSGNAGIQRLKDAWVCGAAHYVAIGTHTACCDRDAYRLSEGDYIAGCQFHFEAASAGGNVDGGKVHGAGIHDKGQAVALSE
jgi:hypothetical protein